MCGVIPVSTDGSGACFAQRQYAWLPCDCIDIAVRFEDTGARPSLSTI